MIQDISPHRLLNEFLPETQFNPLDIIICLQGNTIMVGTNFAPRNATGMCRRQLYLYLQLLVAVLEQWQQCGFFGIRLCI